MGGPTWDGGTGTAVVQAGDSGGRVLGGCTLGGALGPVGTSQPGPGKGVPPMDGQPGFLGCSTPPSMAFSLFAFTRIAPQGDGGGPTCVGGVGTQGSEHLGSPPPPVCVGDAAPPPPPPNLL